MALPSIGTGYQVDDGNLNEPIVFNIPTPQTATTTATLTAAQLLGQVLVGSPGAVAASYTLPTVALLEAALPNPKPGTSFEFKLVNLGTASGIITLLVGTGWTITGLATTPITSTTGSSSQWLAQCVTPGSAWTLYRI